eukprot:tig00001424_g8707.t1
MAGIWAKYMNMLETKPLLTKTLTSTVGFFLGDVIAQSPDMMNGKAYDPARTAKLMAFGATIHGPVGHYWYGLVDKLIFPKTPTATIAVATKVAFDQVFWAPIFTSIFFGFMETINGRADNVIPTIEQKLWPTLLANWKLWPAAHVINFKFIPSNQRVLYINVVSVGWNTFLSTMNAAPAEKKE